MKKILLTLVLLSITIVAFPQANAVVGNWITIDDKTNEQKSVVRIFKAANGMYYGNIEELFQHPDALCEKCEGANKNKPVKGLQILKGMKEDGNKLTGGTILDPQSGDTYYCKISLEKDGRLKLRGSLDKRGLLGRSQYWTRHK